MSEPGLVRYGMVHGERVQLLGAVRSLELRAQEVTEP